MYKLTPTLLNSFYWFSEVGYATESQFLSMLKREPMEETELMKKGNEIELEIQTITEQGGVSNKDNVNEIAKVVQGGSWQVPISKAFNGYMLTGRADVVKPTAIHDIKYCKKYDLGKYMYSAQHLVYMHCLPIDIFHYEIVCGDCYFRETYTRTSDLEEKINNKIVNFETYLSLSNEAERAYKENWVYNAK